MGNSDANITIFAGFSGVFNEAYIPLAKNITNIVQSNQLQGNVSALLDAMCRKVSMNPESIKTHRTSNMTNHIVSPSSTFACIVSVATISIMSLFTSGCEDASQVEGVSWNTASSAVNTEAVTPPAMDDGTEAIPGIDPFLDGASYGAFNWVYGGFNGTRASHSGVTISGLRISGKSLSFNYVNDLSAWGLSYGAADALACLFVLNNAGQWVGGKFDWISSSRKSRGLEHCLGGYGGWSMSGVPNPCQAAFVIVSRDGNRRSNVLLGTWTR